MTEVDDELVASLPVGPGSVIAERYHVDRILAAGGMGAVVTAHHAVLGQTVAIKLLLPRLLKHPEAIERFMREARAMAGLESDYVARVFDVDTLPDGTPYMVMEYLEGSPLDALVDDRSLRSIRGAVDLILEALAGLSAAHTSGIVHRDLKPSNLFLAERDEGPSRIKLLDFGIAKALSGNDKPSDGIVTGTQQLIGSPCYMAPEQISDPTSVDARADIWSIGVILYELLARRRPFVGETIGEVFANILVEDAEPLQDIRPDVSADLAAIVATCLQREREDRYATAREVMNHLAPFGTGRTRTQLALASLPPPAPTEPQPMSFDETVLSTPQTDRSGSADAGAETVDSLGPRASSTLHSATEVAWQAPAGIGPLPKRMAVVLAAGAGLLTIVILLRNRETPPVALMETGMPVATAPVPSAPTVGSSPATKPSSTPGVSDSSTATRSIPLPNSVRAQARRPRRLTTIPPPQPAPPAPSISGAPSVLDARD